MSRSYTVLSRVRTSTFCRGGTATTWADISQLSRTSRCSILVPPYVAKEILELGNPGWAKNSSLRQGIVGKEEVEWFSNGRIGPGDLRCITLPLQNSRVSKQRWRGPGYGHSDVFSSHPHYHWKRPQIQYFGPQCSLLEVFKVLSARYRWLQKHCVLYLRRVSCIYI